MATCSVRWRSSGGRGEYEFVPSGTLEDRWIDVFFEPLDLTIPAEVMGVRAQGKPRLRKADSNDRQKLHLPALVMAVARLPEPAREDKSSTVSFPLENQGFVMNEMHFDIITDYNETATLAPLNVSVLHTDILIDLQDRFAAIAKDLNNLTDIAASYPHLAAAVQTHGNLIMLAQNGKAIRTAADQIIDLQSELFGQSNAGSATVLVEAASLPPTELEEQIKGTEGRILTRIHSFRERDRKLVARAKQHFRNKNGGKLICEACNLDPVDRYGPNGERCIEAHHRTPIAELQPDSITTVDSLAMVCANCHRLIHSQNPCLQVEEVLAAGRQEVE